MTTVYIDTSVAINESFLKSSYCEAFFKACKLLQIPVIIPEIVIDEVKGNVPKKLSEKYALYLKAKKAIEKLVEFQDTLPPLQDAVDSYQEWLDDTLEKHGITVAPYPDVSPKELVEQAYALSKPFKESGEGHKDYLVWKTILAHIASGKSNPPNIFLTNNTNDFCEIDKEGVPHLHTDLSKQINNPDDKPKVYTSVKGAFDAELAPNLEGIALDQVPDLGTDDLDTMVGGFLLDDLPGQSFYGLEGVPFDNEISISSVGEHSIDAISLKRVNDEVVIDVAGSVSIEVDGFMDKSSYYSYDAEDHSMYVVDGNWNDHVMMVSSTVDTPFEMTILYTLQDGKVTGHEITLTQEIEDEWPYK